MSHTPWHLDLDRTAAPGGGGAPGQPGQSGFSGIQNFVLPSGAGSPGQSILGGGGADSTGIFGDLGLNKGTFDAVGSGLGGLGKLASGWAAIKQLGLAKDAFEFKKDFAGRNFEASKLTTNNRIRDQNAWKAAQGRTDLAKLVV